MESSGGKTVLKAPMTAKVPSRWPGKCGPVWPGVELYAYVQAEPNMDGRLMGSSQLHCGG